MCTYCMTGDHFFRFDAPWQPSTPGAPWHPLIPKPAVPPRDPWDIARLHELEDILRRIKALEDQLGCPCEPNKADYLDLIRKRLEQLEKAALGNAALGASPSDGAGG